MNLAQQFKGLADNSIKTTYERKGLSLMEETARLLVWSAINYMDGFHNVTGNTINAIGVGVYQDRAIKFSAFSYEEIGRGPTRKSLKKGERYNLKYYWGDVPVKNIGAPYRGETGDSNYYGFEKARDFIRGYRPSKSKGTCAVVVVAVDYAKYLETAKGADVLTGLRNHLASMGAEVTIIRCS